MTNPERDEVRADDQTLREGDQTLADSDQTQADSDQTASDSDQQASDYDQVAAQDDQAASDRDLAGGGDPSVHKASAHMRNRSAHKRDEGSAMRSDAAQVREAAAEARDLAATARDQVSAMIERNLEAPDSEWSAAQARARAAADRREAAEDRRRAAKDRQEARLEHEAMRQRLAAAELDPLTGVHARAPGLEELEHEIDRARRTTGALAIAYVDVIGLKEVNDKLGHAAGDELLKCVVAVLRAQMRSYDMIVRVGGDEFVCVMSGASTESARLRFDAIRASSLDSGCGIKYGIAELRAEDDGAALIGRADNALPSSPGRA